MEIKKKYVYGVNWSKYLIWGIVFGAIFEMLGLRLSNGIVAIICILFVDNIYINKKYKDNFSGII